MPETATPSPPMFSQDDFLLTDKPFKYCMDAPTPLETAQRVSLLEKQAKGLYKISNFRGLWKAYCAKNQPKTELKETLNPLTFPEIGVSLSGGQYSLSEDKIVQALPDGRIVTIIAQPLTITARLVNIDTGTEKLEIAYKPSEEWRTLIVDKETLSNRSKIVSLSIYGLAVTSENAAEVVKYIATLETLNVSIIPRRKCVGRLGWITGGYFAPYAEGLEYDGGADYQSFYSSVTPSGDLDGWISTIRPIWEGDSVPAKIAIAASFASPIVSKTKSLPFFTHFWGIQSGTGKTVALCVAASVWASVGTGEYVHSFNGTLVSMERAAGFCNSLPLILDEFQLVKDKRTVEQLIYMLTQGEGRTRGTKVGGLQQTGKWRNCIITSGESPITEYVTGAGAYNRALDIEVKQPLFADPVGLLKKLEQHHGTAGQKWIDILSEQGMDEIIATYYKDYYDQLSQLDTTGKQSMAMANIMTAQRLVSQMFFDNKGGFTVEDAAQYLHLNREVDTGARAYEYICDIITGNTAHFSPESGTTLEQWGMVKGNKAYIISTYFDMICSNGGYSSRSVRSWLKTKGFLLVNGSEQRFTSVVRIPGVDALKRCIVMLLDADDDSSDPDEDELI